MNETSLDCKILDRLIVGRVQPRIYAFSTNTVPSFLKVGDTYRPVATRLLEWKRHYPDLEKKFEDKAIVSDNVYFRDYAVHKFLEADLGKSRLSKEQMGEGMYYSREFFADTSATDVRQAIDEIVRSHDKNIGRYDYYDASKRLQKEYRYERGADWTLRPNQEEAVNNFLEALNSGRKNLLMFAVMRFGKSFTSLCCAKAMDANVVLVLSAKADVKSEWKKTTEAAGNFDKFTFLDSTNLLRDARAIENVRAKGETAVVFLTLQDLQGSELKEKHREIFESQIDLLIVDETHFGARAEAFGRVLKNVGQKPDDTQALKRDVADHVQPDEADAQIKELNARVRLHLSGTPYRILMGSEFSKEDIISFVQFSDIVREQEQWDCDNLDKDEVNEWDNPYFGFPQMIRFAFNANESSMRKMSELRNQGISFAFSALLEPKSIKKDIINNHHKYFRHEPEILDFLKVVDGSQQDDGVLGFLDYDRIKDGKMCRHMVMVLPYCASCDAMEELIGKHKDDFKNLGDYKVINISGVEGAKNYKNPGEVKQAIDEAESSNIKTLTLTVNRMLTGSTVEQWDTMLYLKDTSSPQEYDQAIFRLQNQYIRVLTDDKDSNSIKENLKPQTLLVDFDPTRMFQMQEQKSLIYNVNTDDSGNAKLKERLEEELRISPIITMNHNRIQQVEAANILEAISKYNSQRSISDEARDIPVDLELLNSDEIRRVIEAQAEFGTSAGFEVKLAEGDEQDLDIDLADEDPGAPSPTQTKNSSPLDPSEMRSLEKKLQTYYQRILFFVMLTSDEVHSLSEIANVIDQGENQRIARNLDLDTNILREMLAVFDPFKLSSLDYKIQNISKLGRDKKLAPTERAKRAFNKFTNISGSEVRTPSWLCSGMIASIPDDELKQVVEDGEVFLDVASKSGEFAIAFYDRLTNKLGVEPDIAKRSIYSIPTSAIAYEFTRRFYSILGLDVENIAVGFTSYDLISTFPTPDVSIADMVSDKRQYGMTTSQIGDLLDTPAGEDDKLKFGVVVGNPPYQVSDGGAQASARPIYHKFVQLAKELDPRFMTFIVPSRWYAGGKGLEEFRRSMLTDRHIRELHDYPNPETVFPNTNNRGGLCYFLRDTEYDTETYAGTQIFTHGEDITMSYVTRPLDTFGLGIFIRDSAGVEVVQKVVASEGFAPFSHHVSSRKPFGLDGSIVNSPEFHSASSEVQDPVLCLGKGQKRGYIRKELVRCHREWIDSWKVFAPYANNIGTELNDDNQNAFYVPPGTVCSETYLVMGAELVCDEVSAQRLVSYLQTKFARFLLAKAKISQHATRNTYQFLPAPDLSSDSSVEWNASKDKIDEQLFDLYSLNDTEKEHIRASIKDM